MDDRKPFEPPGREPSKKQWVVSKFPIKGGTVIRAASQIDQFYHKVTWSKIEGTIKS